MDVEPPISEPASPESSLPSRLRLAVAVLVVCALLFLTVGATSQALNIPFGLWFSEIFVFLGSAWVLTRMSGRRPWVFARLGKPRPAPLLFGLSLGLVNYFAVVVPLESLAVRFSPELLKRIAPDSTRIFLNQSPVELVFLLLAVGVVAPFCEEFVFRGILQQGFFARSNAWAIGVTAAIFSIFHADPVGFWARLELGILFGWLFLRTGSLWPGICAHAANNLTASVLYFLFKDVKPEEQDTPLGQVFLLALAGSAVLSVLFAWARRRPVLLTLPPPRGELTPGGEPSFYRLAAPWVLSAVLALGALFALDWRGIQLNWMDLRSREPKADGGKLKALEDLRRQARKGEVPLEEYQRRLRALSGGR